MGEKNKRTRHLLPSTKTFSSKNGLHFIETLLQAKTSLVIAKAISCSLPPNYKTYFLKTAWTFVMKHGEVRWCPTRSFTLTD